jgi:hypothetical protein
MRAPFHARALSAVLILLSSLSTLAQNCSVSTFQDLSSALANATNSLRSSAITAHERGIDTTYENITLAVASLFASVFTPADFSNSTVNGVAPAYASWLEGAENRSPAYTAAVLADLPCNETLGALASINAAIVALRAAIADPSSRRPVPPFSLLETQASFSSVDGLLHSAILNSSVVYSSSYCYALCPLGFPESQVAQPTSIPGAHDMHYEWLVLSDTLLPGPGLGVNASEAARIAASAARYQDKHGLRTSIFIDQRFLPGWANAAYPGVADAGDNHNVVFNMDDPVIKEHFWGPVLAAVMPLIVAQVRVLLLIESRFFGT